MEFNCGVHILRARFQVKIFIGLELIKQVFALGMLPLCFEMCNSYMPPRVEPTTMKICWSCRPLLYSAINKHQILTNYIFWCAVASACFHMQLGHPKLVINERFCLKKKVNKLTSQFGTHCSKLVNM